MSVMRLAAPPEAGMVQMLPCRSTASVRPSGETATDIEVPSWTVTSRVGAGAAGAPFNEVTRPRTPTASALRRIKPPPNVDFARILRAGGRGTSPICPFCPEIAPRSAIGSKTSFQRAGERARPTEKTRKKQGLAPRRLRDAAGDDIDDPLAVKATVLDEDRACINSGDCTAGDEETRHVGLESLRVVDRRRPIVERHARAAQEIGVGAVAGQEVHRVGRDFFFLAGIADRARRDRWIDRRVLVLAAGHDGLIVRTGSDELPGARPCRSHHNRVRTYRGDACVEPRGNRAFLDPVLDVGAHPVLDRLLERRRAMDDRDPGAR